MGTAGSRRERLRCYGTTLCQAASGRHQDAGVWDMISGAWGFSESLCHRGTMSAWFSHFPPLVFLFSVISRQSLQQSSLKHSLKFWKRADAIRSACTAGHEGHLVELAQSLALFSPAAVLWLFGFLLWSCLSAEEFGPKRSCSAIQTLPLHLKRGK